MGSWMLTGAVTRKRIAKLPENDWHKHDVRLNEPQLSKHLALPERSTALAERYETSPGAIAIGWMLRNPSADGATVGVRRPDQVDPILPAANLELTDHDVGEIEGVPR
jgi:aryl-alcohol dehydrogenase-like predicted oxidoreductase